ncbi:NADH-quinone oxidoreductase subunit L [Ekhidna sp.]|uniref:NADH-quinone oxidoreductase subunit 5 family protein n=1 Tax=Ekhidna sp. TaxID=2608089 RepID=UPI003CCBF5F7
MNGGVVTILTLTLPLIGGVLAYASSNKTYSIAGIGISFLASLYLIVGLDEITWTFEWLPGYSVSILIDRISSILISLVLFISLLVHVFSIAYMEGDAGKHRYFAKLGFFTFSMVGLLIADHLILLFVFWELVGLASYLLIGFWYHKKGIPASARLAFMVNRIADVALLAGILIVNANGVIDISQMSASLAFLPSILIAVGAFGKSAQLPFSGWLTKAMVGPTPVSALIHAATMVAAGVYLLYRVAPFLHPDVLVLIAFIGAITALYGGVSALFQHDIKKVLAYSTISQLGYMVLGIGVGGASASIFHLFTHAFFKAGLFLGAGSIIHFMHTATEKNGQDMRNMGGLRKELPWTFLSFIVCALALAGLPFFSGFMSKEAIVLSAWSWADQLGTWAYIIPDIALITAFLTALYVGRMVLLVFLGENRLKLSVHSGEKMVVIMPLTVLAIGSLWICYNWNPLAHKSWLNTLFNSDEINDSNSLIVTFLSVLLVSLGLFLSYGLFKPNSPYTTNYSNQGNKFPVALNGFYLSRGYEQMGILLSSAANVLNQLDRKLIDGFIHFLGVGTVVFSKTIALMDRFLVDGPVNGIAYFSGFMGKRMAGLSSRDTQTQLAWLLIGLLLILSWILLI